MAPRLRPVQDPDEETAEILGKTGLRDGRPLNVFATLAHNPRLLKRFNVLGGYFLTRGQLPSRDREVVILRTAFQSRCEYEFGQHTLIGRESGLSGEEIVALARERSDWSERDAVLVAVTDEICATAELQDGTWERLRALYTDQEAIEIIMLAGFYRMLAGFLNTVRVEREAGVPSWPR